MKTFLVSKIVCLAVAFFTLVASLTSTAPIPAIESEHDPIYSLDAMAWGQNLCNIGPICPPNPCRPICPPPKACRPVCPPNPCRPVCPPNPCRPVCPPNPCDEVCVDNSYTEMKLRRIFSSLWEKIVSLRRKSQRKARLALKRRLIEMINYAYSLLACQDCPPDLSLFCSYDFRRMSLKKLFYILKSIVCCLNEKNKCCFLQNAADICYF